MDRKEESVIGMYIIDSEYRIVNFNYETSEMYPNVKLGNHCYRALSLRETPCDICPIRDGSVTFYNSIRKEWIHANAANIEYPEHGACHSIQFRRYINKTGSRSVQHTEQVVDDVRELQEVTGMTAAFAAYCDPATSIIYANKEMAAYLGYATVEEFYMGIDGVVENMIHPDDRAHVKTDLAPAMKPGTVYESIFRMPRKDGSWVHTIIKGKSLIAASGAHVMVAACTEMTKYMLQQSVVQQQNRDLLQKELTMKEMMRHMPGGYHRCVPEEGFPFLYFGTTFEEITGWTKAEIETIFENKFINMVYPEDIPLCMGIVDNVEKNGYSNDIYRIRKKGGGFTWVSDSTLRVDAPGNIFYHGILADITDYIEEMERQRQIAEAVPSGYHRVGAGEGFPLLFISDSFQEIVGWTKEELQEELDNQFINLVAPEDRERFLSMEPDLVRDGRVDAVYRILRKDGSYRWVQDATIRVEHGGEVFYQCTLADITAHVERLSLEKERAEASSRAKTNFLSQMSHDIRTPMNAIVGFTSFARQTDDLEKIQQEYLPKIATASDHLLMLINDVLEMSRIESGQVIIQKEVCDVEAQLMELISVMQMQTEEKELALITDVQVRDRYIVCDINRVNRVFMNLMSNAVKFTPSGGTITVSIIQMEGAGEGWASYEVKVADTGIGMSPAFVEKVFEPFEREMTSTISGMEGTGLGMSIVKNIVDAVDGRIYVDSVQGEGTTFTIHATFELAAQDVICKIEQEKQEKAAEKVFWEKPKKYFAGKRALLVEDNEFNRMIAENILTGTGFFVEQAEDGTIAVDMLQKVPAGYYDVILMDIQMPVMDGYQATREIRAMQKHDDVPIIAMTANAFDEDRKKCFAVGMNGHVSKPIDADFLLETISEVLAE